jgi:hypothetical protein
MEVFNFLTCGIIARFKNLGSELNPRFCKSRNQEIFKVMLKEQ